MQGIDEAPLPLASEETKIPRGLLDSVSYPELVGDDIPWCVAENEEEPLYAGSTVQGRVLDEAYLTSCRFYHHDPRRPSPTNLEIAFRLGNYFGAGVSRSELRQVLRRCKICRQFMYADSRTSHRCDSAPLQISAEDPLADIVSALLSNEESSGFSSQYLRTLLTICSRCDHILQADRLATHDCVVCHSCHSLLQLDDRDTTATNGVLSVLERDIALLKQTFVHALANVSKGEKDMLCRVLPANSRTAAPGLRWW
ncbi:hypothetical protein NMY22_g8046 [Coprinellus aureogranulatus]|nr:hypothetical protein NMY22_g8046 [Coprinellus aureogranulatus]